MKTQIEINSASGKTSVLLNGKEISDKITKLAMDTLLAEELSMSGDCDVLQKGSITMEKQNNTGRKCQSGLCTRDCIIVPFETEVRLDADAIAHAVMDYLQSNKFDINVELNGDEYIVDVQGENQGVTLREKRGGDHA